MINIRYAQIRECDVSNGEGVGAALFVQGCNFHCHNCFNKNTWDFNGGKEWTPEVEDKFIELASRPYIKRISILGGEPLADENLDGVLNLVNRIRLLMPEKTIWIYTGFKFGEIFRGSPSYLSTKGYNNVKRRRIIEQCDVMIDGKYIDLQRNLSLKWRGSENQRVINVKETLQQRKVILYCE